MNPFTSPINFRQIFATPALWAFLAAIAAFKYPLLGWPLLAVCVACFYWAFRASFVSQSYVHFLGGILLFGTSAGIAFVLLACVLLGEEYSALRGSGGILPVMAGLLWLAGWFCFFYFRQYRKDWRDFQVQRQNRFLDATDNRIAWRGKSRAAAPARVSLFIGAGIAAMTIAGVFLGKEHVQTAVATLSTIGIPVLLLGYGMHVIIGLLELRKVERSTGTRFLLPHLDDVQRIRAQYWIARLFNPELRAIHRVQAAASKTRAKRT
ncbi:hypothetical protein [Paraburkholderia bannensis]|uniref:hypothetical protein n=1 Tax=Paraburkholderia bannensis TaxID=765414 RepID=UPI002ABE837F|nr:hypothetical protein [Paraburkholderia bannensis]